MYDIVAPLLHISNDIRSLILNLCSNEDRKVVGRFAMTIKILWHNRNDFIWNNDKEDESRLGWLAFHMWQEWWLVQNTRDREAAPLNIHHCIPLMVGSSVMSTRYLTTIEELLIDVGVFGMIWGIFLIRVFLGMLVLFLS